MMKEPTYVKIPNGIMSMYDAEKNIIYYANELTRLHEYRHYLQRNDYRFTFAQMCASWLVIMSLAYLIANNHTSATITFLLFLLHSIYIEIDAWVYAIKNKKVKHENQSDNQDA